MNDAKLDKWAALSGLAFVVLAVIGAFIAGSPPKVSEPDANIIQFTKDNQDSLRISAYIGGLTIVAFLVFLGALVTRLRRADTGSGRFAATAAAGGAVAIAVSAVANGVNAYGALHPGGSAGTYRLATVLFGFVGFGALVLTVATSLETLRSKFLPAWLGWSGILVAILWLVGSAAVATEDDTIFVIGFVAFLAWALWLIALSVLLFRTSDSATT